MKVAICDPVLESLECIKMLVQQIPCIEEIELYTNIKYFIEDIRDGKYYDVVLMELDLEEEKTGIDYSEELYSYNTATRIVFMTSNASEHIEEVLLKTTNLGGFLIKPLKLEMMRKVFGKLEQQASSNDEKLVIRYKGSICMIPFEDIIYMESRLHKVNIVLNRITYQCNEKLEQICERLNNENFLQCHKSYAVNIKHISSYKRYEVVLDNGMVIPISKKRNAEVREYLEEKISCVLNLRINKGRED